MPARKLLILAIIFLSPLTAAGDDGIGHATKQRIGVLVPLTGDFAAYGATVRRGIEKIGAPEVEWVFEDEACDPAKAVTAYRKLSDVDQVKYIIGPCCGSPQKAIAPLIKTRRQLALLPSAAPASVFATSGKRMYSVQYSLDADARFIAAAMNRRGLRKVAIVYVDSDYGETLEAAFRRSFGGQVVFAFRAPAFDVLHMKDAALKLKLIEFDSLFIPDASPLLLGFLSELRKIGITKKPVFSVDAAQMQDILTTEKDNAEGLIYSYPDVPSSEDAFEYLAAKAAQLLARVVANCSGASECVEKSFAENTDFSEEGTLRGEIILKTIRGGRFVALSSLN